MKFATMSAIVTNGIAEVGSSVSSAL